MKFPSLKTLRENAFHSLLRFPLALLFAFVGTVLAVSLVDMNNDNANKDLFIQLLFTCFIGLPCLLGCHLYAERRGKLQKLVLPIIGVVVVALYGFYFAPKDGLRNGGDIKEGTIFLLLNICMHLWVAVAAYIGKKEPAGFWRFNELLFTRIVLTVIFSGVLYAGLSLSLLSIDQLFGFDIDDDYYGKLFLIVAGVFNTWFFLSGIPRDYKDVNQEKTFPKGLKIFTQYILIPLTILYMLILYAYGFKIIAQWELPKGWVSMLVMCYSLVGILATLLVYPLRGEAENAWVRLFAKFFFIAILPLVVLLFVAIGIRISDYGITELRYYLLMLGSWLGVIALYFTLSKQKNIKLIPLTLLFLGLLSLFGPWSVFSISHNSQFSRLEKIYTKYEIAVEGQPLAKPTKEVENEDLTEVSNIIDYLVERDYLDKLSELYQTDIYAIRYSISSKNEDNWYTRSDLKDTLMVMANLNTPVKAARRKYKYYRVNSGSKAYSFGADGYNQGCYISYYRFGSNNEEVLLKDSVAVKIDFSSKKGVFVFEQDNEVIAEIDLFNHLKIMEENHDNGDVPIEYMQIEGIGKTKVKMIIYDITLDMESKRIKRVNSFEGVLLFE